MNKILVSSLEPSATIHLKEVLKHTKNISLCGIFDEKFGNPIYTPKNFSVMGIVDVLKKYFFALRVMKEMVELAREVNSVLLIDAPAFNLPLAKKLKSKYPNIQIYYYILPKAWAWKKNRIQKVEKYCDDLISIFPFEQNYYKTSKYFGNPLMDEINELNQNYKIQKYISFLAGSRKSEIKFLMPVFREIAKYSNDNILVIPDFFKTDEIEDIYGDISNFTIKRNTNDALKQSKFAYICSGTATMESAIIGTPFILVYKAKALEYAILSKIVNIKYVGLANIILNKSSKKTMHPELLQNDVDAIKAVALKEKYDYDRFDNGVSILRNLLKKGCSKKVANLLDYEPTHE